MNKRVSVKSKTAASFSGFLLMLLATPAGWAVNIADTPLFLAVTVPPNIVVTLDDSGSMKRSYVPDLCGGGGDDCAVLDNRYIKSATGNPLHYNPNVQYPQGRRADGSSIATLFTAAWNDGFDTAFGSVNLSNNYRPTAYLNHGGGAVVAHGFIGHYGDDVQCSTASGAGLCQIRTPAGGWSSGITACVGATAATRKAFCRGQQIATSPFAADVVPGGVPAYYYVFDGTRLLCTGATNDNNCYRIVLVSATSGPGNTDERQNFANWYSFARTRNLSTATAASIAFVDLDPTARLAWQGLNSCYNTGNNTLVNNNCQGWRNNFINKSNAIRDFTGQHKADFYAWISQQWTNNSTPLPVGMTRAGEYYRTTGENSPYDNNFSTAASGQYSCRRNYHILMTDGLWNATVGIGNVDNSTIVLPEVATEPQPNITRYTPIAPYKDSASNTLSDVAMRYALMDLAPSLPNKLLPIYRERTGTATQQYWNPRNDPYTWQHMVNFTIGLGLSSFIPAAGLTWTGNMYGGSYPDIVAGTQAWPAASTAEPPANITDMWHAAINSRGQFFAADNPAALGAAFRQALVAITSDAGSSAALSTNSTSVQPGTTVVYQAKFSRGWTGSLLALPVAADGAVGSLVWDASKVIPAWASRSIYTWDGTSGQRFDGCGRLNNAQRTALNTDIFGVNDGKCDQRLDWLRGDASREQRNGGVYRNRADTVMGDVINSDPAYVKDIDYGYASLPAGTPGQASYNLYRTANLLREPMVYVGANDGMLHGFLGSNGVENFSYVPYGVYSNLSKLTAPTYEHKFFVDGGITVSDAYLGGSWKTILAAGLNAGGNTVYAIDVSRPGSTADSDVLWEFSEADLGLSYSQPQIGILENGQWVAVFGNGYNSGNGGAYLYVVDLKTGNQLAKIKASDIPGNEGNGLSTPLLYDSDGDKLIDTVYAGDLLGNMWKFDVSGVASASWNTAFSGAPLFTARSATNTVQPITAQPKAAAHPSGGSIVMFGTGRYLTYADVSDTSIQTFYGIRDDGANPILTTDRSQLQVQLIDLQTTGFGRDVRSFTGNSPDWITKVGWYVDLRDPVQAVGERVISTPIVKEDRVIFVTAVPSSDPCTPGGTSWLMELNFLTGGTFDEAVLDLNNDGLFDDKDNVNNEVIGGVRNQALGISKTPVWLQATPNSAFKIMTGTSGGFQTERNRTSVPPPVPGANTVLRRSWVQIR